jgi:hypothetical protein
MHVRTGHTRVAHIRQTTTRSRQCLHKRVELFLRQLPSSDPMFAQYILDAATHDPLPRFPLRLAISAHPSRQLGMRVARAAGLI